LDRRQPPARFLHPDRANCLIVSRDGARGHALGFELRPRQLGIARFSGPSRGLVRGDRDQEWGCFCPFGYVIYSRDLNLGSLIEPTALVEA